MQIEDEVGFHMSTSEVGLITLNQPRRRNALTTQMWRALSGALERAAGEAGLKVLVITGAGTHFAAGADISEFSTVYATPESSTEASLAISNALEAVANFPRPTLAKVRGACIGGGAGIALACDIRFADDTAKFAITPGKLGLVYPFSDVRRLVQTVGLANAKDILFSARFIEAEEAKQMGLINHLGDQSELEKMVLDFALSICATSKNSAQITKQMFTAISEGQRVQKTLSQQWFLDAFKSEDFQEGYTAFLEKRKPNF